MSNETKPRRNGSRLVAGGAMALVFGGTAYAFVSVTGWGGVPWIAGAGALGFVPGYAAGLFVTEVLIDLLT